MIKRLFRIFAFAAAVLLSPLWVIIWLLSGRNILFWLMNFATDYPGDEY